MTALELKQAISNLPDDGEVYVQRIEDKYFEDHGWSVKLMEGHDYHMGVAYNKCVDEQRKYTQEDLNSMREQYMDTWCCINYDGKNLYISSHY